MLGNLGGWHLLILSVVWIVPFVITVVSIARNRVASGTAKAVWVLIPLLFPWLGLILWFTIGRKPAPAR
ncbi:phospholipase D-like protein [Microbacterium kyungheense]|uniref:Phospholipase D-like protein n=1 Tax=Microbacterium kyungheense TaxID=1263636 RepID=A0A543F240_9MICO|nr:phospholipase D-like protein [Microbacterium kyungheense]